jgi:dTDP-4-dehydrorhamnose 3,5-epimerase
VGTALRAVLPAASFATHAELDVTDAPAVTEALDGVDVVIHLAAMTNVDRCEEDPERGWSVNEMGTINVCRAAPHARVIYFSTDYVFPGDAAGEYSEEDTPCPLNVYGETKLAGERAVLELRDGLVIRTSWVYGDGRNFLRTVLTAARSGVPLRIVADQRGRPTAARSLAAATCHMIALPMTGILHVSDDGDPTTWADLAEVALREAGIDAPVTRVSSAEYGAAAKRPANSTLCLARARRLGVPLPGWHEGVRQFAREWAR